MRFLVALMPVFMVSVAVAQGDRPTGDYDVNDTVLRAKCQFRSAGASGPIYACKDPKTGKVVNIECKVPPKIKMPKELSGAKLQKMCYVPDGRNDGKVT